MIEFIFQMSSPEECVEDNSINTETFIYDENVDLQLHSGSSKFLQDGKTIQISGFSESHGWCQKACRIWDELEMIARREGFCEEDESINPQALIDQELVLVWRNGDLTDIIDWSTWHIGTELNIDSD